MIQLIQNGHYSLIETKASTKILSLDGRTLFAWVMVADIGEILITTHKKHAIDHILSVGKYRIYTVKDEPEFTDLVHVELFVGDGKWQGYLLPTGLPTDTKKRNRIIPTKEIITLSSV